MKDARVWPRDPLRSFTIRASLLVGFGLTFGLWLFAGYQFTRRMAHVQTETAAINARYTQAQELLSTIRAHVLLGSVYVRDALLDTTAGTADAYRTQLEDAYRAADAALDRYRPVWDSPDERERVARLRREIDLFRGTLLEVLGSGTNQGPAHAWALLRKRIVPQREVVIRVSDEVQALNRAEFVRHQTDLATMSRAAQRRVRRQLGLALTASLAIALLGILYAGGLEARLRRQMAKDLENSRNLQRLSNQLIKAQEEERRSIARELHDEIGQALTAIKMELAVAQRTIAAADGPADVLEDARSIVDGTLQSARDLSHLLHPALLDDLGLPAAVDWYLRGFGKRHAIAADLLEDRMEERLAPEIETAAYRIIQEALTNVAKHARATSCRVYLQRLPTSVLVTIEDDGVGFDPVNPVAAEGGHGLGLTGVRERASQMGGTVRLETGPGKGTRLTIELPARPRTAALDSVATAPPASSEVVVE